MKKITLIYIAILAATCAKAQLLPVYGGERAGASALSFLKNDVSPTSVAMGGASVSLAGDAYSIYNNVAAMADLRTNHFAITHSFLGAGINQSFGSGMIALKKQSSVLGFSINSLNSGAIEERTEFMPGGTGRMIYVNNIAFGASYAQQLSTRFSMGATLKYVYENLADFTNHALNVDLGFLYKTDYKDLKFAVLVRNFGSGTSLTGDYLASSFNRTPGTTLDKSTLPNVFSMGLSMVPWKIERHSILVAFQLNHPNDNSENYRFGAEYNYMDILMIRTGYKISVQGQTLPTFGFGLRMMMGAHPLFIDYAANPTNYIGVQHQIGLRFNLNKSER
jgi:hypothetical protein